MGTIDRTTIQPTNPNERLYGVIENAIVDKRAYYEYWHGGKYLVMRSNGHEVTELEGEQWENHVRSGRDLYPTDLDGNEWETYADNEDSTMEGRRDWPAEYFYFLARPTWDREGYEYVHARQLELFNLDLINKLNRGGAVFEVKNKQLGIRHKAGKERLFEIIPMDRVDAYFAAIALTLLDLLSFSSFAQLKRAYSRDDIKRIRDRNRKRKMDEIHENIRRQDNWD